MNQLTRRLAIFAPDLVVGGAERSMLKLAEGLTTRGYEVDLVLARAQGALLCEVPAAVRLVNLKAHRVLTSLPALVRYLRREQPIALLSVLHSNLIALWAQRIARASSRIIVSERDTLSSEVQHYRSDLRMQLMPYLIRRFYPRADGIVAVSKGVAADLSQATSIPIERIRVIYNPIVTPRLQEKAQASCSHPWFEPGQPPVVLAVGRLVAQKDFSTLIQAFAQVRQTQQARLVILGEGEERPSLEALIEQLDLQREVELPGFVANPYPYMVRAAVFVLSSRWEGLPGALIEAMYCGAPLVSTDCPSGPREILADGQYGQLVPVADINALARATEKALSGEVPRPPQESWRPFELETVVTQYLQTLVES